MSLLSIIVLVWLAPAIFVGACILWIIAFPARPPKEIREADAPALSHDGEATVSVVANVSGADALLPADAAGSKVAVDRPALIQLAER